MARLFSNAPSSIFTDEKYIHYIAEYSGNIEAEASNSSDHYLTIINDKYVIVSYSPNNIIEDRFTLKNNPFPSIVYINRFYLYTLQSLNPVNAANINLLQIAPPLYLTGKDVLVGLIDTGIDYLNKEFLNDDGTSRVVNIWDQTINNSPSPADVPFGSVYYKEDINNAIKAFNEGKDPYTIVPSKDTIGHGTAMAGVIGAKGINPTVKGAAPECTFVVVKLAESLAAKKFLNPTVPIFDQASMVLALTYLLEYVLLVNKPMVIYLPLGTTLGNHRGYGFFEEYINNLSNNRGIAIVTGTGNEANTSGHTSGTISQKNTFKDIQLYISEEQKYLRLEVWVTKPNIFSLEVISASGENSGIIPAFLNKEQESKFIFEKTTVKVSYYLPDELSGDELIEVDLINLTPGIWKLRLFSDYVLDGSFNVWLEPKGITLGNTGFTSPDPYGTFTNPGSAQYIITIGNYNQNNYNVVNSSGMAFISNPSTIDVVAGGVDVTAIVPNNKTTIVNGTSVSAAVATGAIALMFQWGLVEGNDPNIYSKKLKTYLSRGTSKRAGDVYPNAEWGYGVLDMLGVFKYLE